MSRLFRGIFLSLVTAVLLTLPGAVPDTLEFKVYREAYGDYFNVLGWMMGQLGSDVVKDQNSLSTAGQTGSAQSEAELVKRYLKLNEQIEAATPRAGSRAQPNDDSLKRLEEERDRLEPQAQAILRKQVEQVLREEGFTSTVAGHTLVFPPPLFSFAPLPKILVVSPRDRIMTVDTLALKPSLSWTGAEAIEERVGKMGFSALVVPIGGLGAYPPMIPRSSSLEFLAKTLAHEWAHNYLTLRPLGLRYTLQVERDYEVVTMNESTASIIGEEIGDRILNKYYGYPVRDHPRKPEKKAEPSQPSVPVESDFTKRMRAIRLKVDDYLAKGLVDEAEKYMTEEQVKLQEAGYDVRKLNQAYFAFHGTYATTPGYTNPLGDAVSELRYNSPSLKAFVDRIGEMRNSAELKKALTP